MFRRLIIWILLLSLPLQSFAAVGIIHCPPTQQEERSITTVSDTTATHTHTTNLARANSATPLQEASADHHQDDISIRADADGGGHHGSGDSHHVHKTACCAGAAMLLPSTSSATVPSISSSVIRLTDLAFLPTVFLEGLKRPPRTLLA